MYNNINCILLAGGKSLRMGEEKALLKVGTQSMLEYTIHKVKPLFNKVILSTNTPEKFAYLQLEMYADTIMGGGPLSGIYTGLINSDTERNFVISCDMPLITPEAIEFIIEYDKKSEIVIARADGYIQQLCGVYTKSVISKAKSILNSTLKADSSGNMNTIKKKCKVLQLIEIADSKIFNFANEYPFDSENLFFNMNKKEDYAFILSKLGLK